MISYYPTTDQIAWHTAVLSGMLNALTAIPGAALFVLPQVRLYTTARTPTPSADDPTAFDEATFTGYAKQTATLSTPVNIGAEGKAREIHADFTCTTTGVAQAIYGWYLTDEVTGNPTKVYAEGAFDPPLSIQDAGDHIGLTILLPVNAFQSR